MQTLTLGLIIGTGELAQEITDALADIPARIALEQRDIPDWSSFLEKLERIQPDLLILNLCQLTEPLDRVIRQVKATSASPKVIVVDRSTAAGVILSAVRAGADEYLYPPLKEDLEKAVERIGAERLAHRAGTHPRGKVLGFLSAKGGCGATTIACHVGLELHRQTNLRVLLADFDLDSGIIGFLMNTQSRYSLADAVENARRMDLSLWKALVSNGTPGLEIISGPNSLGGCKPADPENFRAIVRFVHGNYDWSLLDLGSSLSQVVMHLVDEIDETFIVTTAEIPALHQAKQMIQTLFDARIPQHKIHVLLNRAPRRMEVTLEELDRMLGASIYATVPSDYQALYDAYAERTLLASNSNLGLNFARVASRIAGLSQKQKKKKMLSFLG